MWNPFAPKPALKPVETMTRTQHREVVRALNEQANMIEKVGLAYKRERDSARNILRAIVALETPGSAHIGRKMAAKAREGLPEYAASDPDQEAA